MNFQQAETKDILEVSRWEDWYRISEFFEALDSTAIGVDTSESDLFSEDVVNAYVEDDTDQSTVNYLLAQEELGLQDVESFASDNGLIDNELFASQEFYELHADIVDNGTDTDINCTFNDFIDSLQKEGRLHGLQTSYEFDYFAKAY